MLKFFSFSFPGLLAFLLLALRLPATAQAPAWQSARAVAVATTAANNNYLQVTATAVDAAGNVYLAGSFTNSVALGGTTLTSLGSFDVFVTKFNPASSQFVWAQRAGGTGDDFASALAVSGTSVYVAGNFISSTANFGPAILTSVGPNNYFDVFVAKLIDAGSTGSFVWAQQAGGVGYYNAPTLAVSGTSVYVAGTFAGPTASFGPLTLTSAGSRDVFVAKLIDAGGTGSFAWAQRAGGTGDDYATALAVSGPNVYVAGYFATTANFGAITLTSAGFVDVFVAKLIDAGGTGSFAWAQRAGGTDSETAYALAVSGTSVYVAGVFASPTANFGAITLISAGYGDVFVAKLIDAGGTGSFAWTQRAGGPGDDYATALAVSGPNVYVAGIFRGPTTDFGPTTLTNAGGSKDFYDLFLAKLTDAGSTGSFAWAQGAGGPGDDYATALAVSGPNVYVAGYFASPTADFGTSTLLNPYHHLGFLASLTDLTLTANTAAVPREPASLYPNPAHGTATLRLPAGTAPVPLTLTDALGRAVRRYPAPAGPEAALDLRGLPAGLYLLRGAGPAQRLVVE